MAPTSSAMSAYSDLNRFSREDKDMSEHTNGPWIANCPRGMIVSMSEDATGECSVICSWLSDSNARRIAACVNALEGLTTEQIEDGAFQKMREDRDFLAAELYKATQEIKYWSEEVVKLKIERNHTGVAIDNAIRGALPYEHPLLSRLGMIANIAWRHKRNAQLLEQINNAETSQYLSAADMLHDIKKIASRAIED